jgi:type I restriction enzyme M protein
VITGELKASVDRIWDAFWSGGIANPLEVMEQITYLLFVRRLDELQTAKENKANRLGTAIDAPIFPAGDDDTSRPYADLRWSRFKDREPDEMFAIVAERVFPFMRQVGGDASTYSHHMRDARFTIPTPALLSKVVDMLDGLPMEGRDTKGDVYEYMLSKIASAGQNGQFRTPRHIIQLMVAMAAPTPKDERPGLRHRRISHRRRGASAARVPRRRTRPGSTQALSQQHVPRLRLRRHDAADRLDEHALTRRRSAGYPLPRLFV